MGLDVSHGCWSGPYSQFMRWRTWLAARAGYPLGLMEGFFGYCDFTPDDLVFEKHYNAATSIGPWAWDALKACTSNSLPIKWPSAKVDPIVILLHHSDCDGAINWWDAKPLALSLLTIIRSTPDDWHIPEGSLLRWESWRDGRGCYDGMVPPTKRFAVGLMAAYKAREKIIFA